MKQLSSRQTYITKYLVASIWIIAPISIAINQSNKLELLFIFPIFILIAFISYMPMKISYDKTSVVVSDLFSSNEYRFSNITLLEYSRPTIPYHPYQQLEITTKDNKLKKIQFIPRGTESFKSLFKKGLLGRQLELMDFWNQHKL